MHIDFNGIEIASIFGALALSIAILAFADPLGRALGVLDYPDATRKLHLRPTPLIGGLAMMVPLLLWAAAGVLRPDLADDGRRPLAVLVCGGGAALVGFIDDRHTISAGLRLVALLGLSALALALDPRLLPDAFHWGQAVSTPVAPWLAYLLVSVGIAGFVNAVNMADGQDGCVAGMFAIWSFCTLWSGGGSSAALGALLFATSLAVLAFNLRGKVFLGGAGAYGVTFVFALLILTLHDRWHVTAEAIVVWLFVPVVDCLRLTIGRPLAGRSPFQGDRNHFHHRLHDRYGKNEGLAIYLGIVAAASLIATFRPDMAPACLVGEAVLYAGLMWLTRARKTVEIAGQG
jgi:UDP-GlcNAc:undecaprenyl-phosphate/decaprenyl-phosphate GlcNAc-1-phosphate transferase